MINNDKKSCKLLINKAFTLIELLAVIVILAVIAVIATPIVLGVIDDSKLKAKENSVNGLMEAVNMTYTKSQLSAIPLKLPITATINNGVITATDGTNSVEVTYTGERPISGTIKIDGFGGLSASNIKYSDNYICTKGNGENGCTNHKFSVPVGTYVKKDTLDADRLVYYGDANNNYIYLKENGDAINTSANYRIVSIESDGTIKVIRNAAVTSMSYDSRSGAGTEPSPYVGPRRNEANSYCNYANSYNNYYGCNAWSKVNGIYTNKDAFGTVSTDSEIKPYLNTTYYNLLDEKVRGNIVTHSFSLASLNFNSASGTGLSISALKTNMEAEPTWEGKIGLLDLRDWFNAALTCAPENSGGYYKDANPQPTYTCSQNNYLHNSTYWWLMSPYASDSNTVFIVGSPGYVNNNYAYYMIAVRPVFYLSSNITLSGDGTTENPYRIKS